MDERWEYTLYNNAPDWKIFGKWIDIYALSFWLCCPLNASLT